MAEKANGRAPRPAGQKQKRAVFHLVISERGRVFGGNEDPDRADTLAARVGGLVVTVPIAADHRRDRSDG